MVRTPVQLHRRRSRLWWGFAVGVLMLGPADIAHGGVIASRSSAFDLSIQLGIVPVDVLPVIIDFDPLNQVAAPPDATNTLLNLSLGGLVATLDEVAATAVVNTPQGNAFARATFENLLMTLGFFSIGATTIESTAEADETNFVIALMGDTTLGQAGLTIFGNNFALPPNPAPNTALVTGLAGVTVMLNEQDLVQTSGAAGITVTGIHVSFANAIGPDLTRVNGNIFLARSQATLALDPTLQEPGEPIPEPATLQLLALGLLSLWFVARRRKLR